MSPLSRQRLLKICRQALGVDFEDLLRSRKLKTKEEILCVHDLSDVRIKLLNLGLAMLHKDIVE